MQAPAAPLFVEGESTLTIERIAGVESLYDILGVNPDADDATIKKNYRKLALKLHPDKNPENSAYAEEVFKTITAAFGILSDASTHAAYDRATAEDKKEKLKQVLKGVITATGTTEDQVEEIKRRSSPSKRPVSGARTAGHGAGSARPHKAAATRPATRPTTRAASPDEDEEKDLTSAFVAELLRRQEERREERARERARQAEAAAWQKDYKFHAAQKAREASRRRSHSPASSFHHFRATNTIPYPSPLRQGLFGVNLDIKIDELEFRLVNSGMYHYPALVEKTGLPATPDDHLYRLEELTGVAISDEDWRWVFYELLSFGFLSQEILTGYNSKSTAQDPRLCKILKSLMRESFEWGTFKLMEDNVTNACLTGRVEITDPSSLKTLLFFIKNRRKMLFAQEPKITAVNNQIKKLDAVIREIQEDSHK
ncbi:J domain-containing protein [Candidatus Dependentiae bacterium]|nr:J domain-containing protein [Candidatus Dependentiae bacterium]